MNSLLEGLLATAAYTGVGLALLVLGFFVLDLLTPGKLADEIFKNHRRDATIFAAVGLVSLAAIIATAIYSAGSETWETFGDAVAYGLLGIVLQAVAFLVLDVLTPGKLGETLTDDTDDHAVWLMSAMQISVAVITIASIT